jgi:hypothetical protein
MTPQDDKERVPSEFASNQMPKFDLQSARETLRAYGNTHAEKPKLAVELVKVVDGQPSSPPTVATFTEAVNEFTNSATALIVQLPLLTKTRNSYEKAMRASAELRKVLDTGEENLRSLMTQLEQVLNPAPYKKKPEPTKVETIRGNNESTDAVNWP